MGKGDSTVTQTQFDPLYPGSGGSDIRSDVYGRRNNYAPSWGGRADTSSAALESKAADPVWGTAWQLGSDIVGGKYLGGSPQLTDQINTMRQQSERESGDMQNRVRSQYARTGNTISTGVNQQLLNADAAARGRSEANQSAILGQNYGRERDMQRQAVAGQLQDAANGPSNLRALATQVQMDPLKSSADLAVELSGGAQTNTPTVIQKPGALDYALGFTSALG